MIDKIEEAIATVQNAPVALHANKEMIARLEARLPKRHMPDDMGTIMGMPIVQDDTFEILPAPTGVLFKTREARAAWLDADEDTRREWIVFGKKSPVAMKADGTWCYEDTGCPDGLVAITFEPEAT